MRKTKAAGGSTTRTKGVMVGVSLIGLTKIGRLIFANWCNTTRALLAWVHHLQTEETMNHVLRSDCARLSKVLGAVSVEMSAVDGEMNDERFTAAICKIDEATQLLASISNQCSPATAAERRQ